MASTKAHLSVQSRIDHLEIRGITKRFPGVLANDRIDFDVRSGEVHALLGENGAGKSTLMKVLYGMYHPDEGEILMNGQPVTIASPTDAIACGIGMIHQHFMLVQSLTVAENVALGFHPRASPDRSGSRAQRILELGKVYGLEDRSRMRTSGSYRSASSSAWRSSRLFIVARRCWSWMSRPQY